MPNDDPPDDATPRAAAAYDEPCPNDDGWNPACGFDDGDEC